MAGTYTMARVGDGDVAGIYAMDGEHFAGMPSFWATHVWVDDVAATVAMLNLFKGSGHRGAARQGMAPGAVGWNELATPDPAAAAAFYTALFGWEAQTGPVPGDDSMQYTTFLQDGQGIGGMMAMEGESWAGVPPHWLPYLTVTDCAERATAVEALGGSVRVAPQTVPNVGTFAVVADPTGATFSIMQWDMPAA